MAPNPPAVLIDGLTKRLGKGVLAVDHVNLRVEQGQVVGLAGPNGAGKSVTMKILLGLVRPTAGRVELFGEPVRPGAQVLGRVGALVDGPGFVPHMSGMENLRIGWRMTRRKEGEADFERAVEVAGLGSAINRSYKTYSHGMRYRLGLAQALLGKPDLLLLDEPTTGLDPAHVLEVRAAIRTAAGEGGGGSVLQPSTTGGRAGLHARRRDAERAADRVWHDRRSCPARPARSSRAISPWWRARTEAAPPPADDQG